MVKLLRVFRGIIDYGASEDFETASVSGMTDADDAFIRATGALSASAGAVAGTGSNTNNRDLGSTLTLTASEEAQATRYGTATDEDVRVMWEAWEFLGDPGSRSRIITHFNEVALSNGDALDTTTVVPVAAASDKIVPFLAGVRQNQANSDWTESLYTLDVSESLGVISVQAQRTDSTGASRVGYYWVEFAGANWTVQRVEFTFVSTLSVQTVSLTDTVDWDHSFIVSTHRTTGSALEDCGWLAYPGTDGDSIRFYKESGSVVGTVVAYIISNPLMDVTHEDSVSGSGSTLASGSSNPQSESISITAVPNLDRASLFMHLTCSGGGPGYPRGHSHYRFESTSSIEVWRARSGQDREWAYQVVVFPDDAADVDVQAEPATVTVDADHIIQTDVAVQAPASVTVDVDRIIQTDVAVQAGNASVTVDSDHILQSTVSVTAEDAAVTIDSDKVVQTATAVQAEPAALVSAGQRIDQLAVALQTEAATITPATVIVRQAPQLAAQFAFPDSLAISGAQFDTATETTWEFWFSADVIQPRSVVEVWSATTADQQWQFLALGGGALSLNVRDSNAATTITLNSAHTYAVGEWIHVLVEIDQNSDQVSLQINGNAVETLSQTGLTVPTSGVGPAIGFNNEFLLFFGGRIQRVRMWTRLLNSTERSFLYNEGEGRGYLELSSGDKASMVAAWELNELSDASRSVPRLDSHTNGYDISDPLLVPSNGGHGTVLRPEPATVTLDVAIFVPAEVDVQAEPATVTVDADHIIQTDVAVQAEDAAVVVDVDRVIQTDVSVQAGNATVTIDADHVIQTSVSVQAEAATVTVDSDRVLQTDASVSAGVATATLDADHIIQSAVAVQSEDATMTGTGAFVVDGTVTVEAGDASTATDADKVVQTEVSVGAGDTAATTDADHVIQTTVALQAGNATTTIAAEIGGVNPATVDAQAGNATTDANGQRISQSATAVGAGDATTTVPGRRVVQSSVSVQAAPATTAVNGTIIDVQTDVSVQAEAATVVIGAELIRQAGVSVQAGGATANVLGLRISQTDTSVESEPATVDIFGGPGIDISLSIQAGPATALIDADHIIQTDVDVQPDPAIGRATDQVIIWKDSPQPVIMLGPDSVTVVERASSATVLLDPDSVDVIEPRPFSDFFLPTDS